MWNSQDLQVAWLWGVMGEGGAQDDVHFSDLSGEGQGVHLLEREQV